MNLVSLLFYNDDSLVKELTSHTVFCCLDDRNESSF